MCGGYCCIWLRAFSHAIFVDDEFRKKFVAKYPFHEVKLPNGKRGYEAVPENLGKTIDYFIYDHSHVPDLTRGSEMDGGFPAEIVGNCGSWVRGRKAYNTYTSMNEDGVGLEKLHRQKPIR
jgi:hypothetical protein